MIERGNFSFDTVSDGNCWQGVLTDFEQTLLRPAPFANLDLLRRRLLHASTITKAPDVSARSVVQMAFETEIGVVLRRLVVIAQEVFSARVCPRRKYIEIDADLQPYAVFVDAAFDELEQDARIPEPYLRLYRRYAKGAYPRYRVCGLAALMCLEAHYYLGAHA